MKVQHKYRSTFVLTFLLIGLLTLVWGSHAYADVVLTRVTTKPGTDSRTSQEPAISGDGNRVVFVSDSDFHSQMIQQGNGEVWLYEISTAELTRLTEMTGTPRFCRNPSINHDGTKVVFSSAYAFSGPATANNQNEIWLSDTATTTLTRLTVASDTNRRSGGPKISADGQRVAFVSDSDFNSEGIGDNQWAVWLYDPNNPTLPAHQLKRLTEPCAIGRGIEGLSFSADGNCVAFASNNSFPGHTINNYEIWHYNIATEELRRVTNTTQPSRDSEYHSISGDGTVVVFESDADFKNEGIADQQTQIWLYDVPSANLTRLTTDLRSGRRSYDPSISAGGSTVVFLSTGDFNDEGIPDSQYEIWSYDIASSQFTRITPDPARRGLSAYPAPNTYGNRLVFQSNSDFNGDGIELGQDEIWLATITTPNTNSSSGGGGGGCFLNSLWSSR